jgi:hypothetical protein
MTRPRFAAAVLVLLTFAGCHEDPKVQEVTVPASATALAIFTNGGTGNTKTGNAAGAGANGGSLIARVVGDLNLGGTTTLVAPTVPTAPTTGNAPLTSPTTGVNTTGTIIISGNVNVDTATANATFTTSNGDIVVSGNLRTVLAGATQNDITLNAPAGTVYITGSIVTSSSDNTDSGDFGGNVNITAARIVITGTIDTQGEAGAASGTGGDGGDVILTSTNGPIIITGSVLTSGGTGAIGGNGGIFSLLAATALQIFGPVTTDGGEATATATKPVGGNAGNVILSAGGSIDVSSTIHQRGGNGNGGTQGADGGTGGTFTIGDRIPVKIYGTLDVRGGTAEATSIGVGTLAGGLGGSLVLGNPGLGLLSLEMGRGTWSTIGGSGVTAVGDGGAIDLQTEDGIVTLGCDLDARGGSATGSAVVQGGKGGDVTVMGDTTANATTSHPLTVNFLASVNSTGGAGTGSGNGGAGGAVTFQCGGDITLPIAITTTGGAAVTGTGGKGGNITVTVANAGDTPLGSALLTGVLTALGGVSSSGPGGGGGTVLVDTSAAAVGDITSSADISTSGTAGFTGVSAGGTPGDITFTTAFGNLTLSGTIAANGGNSIATPTNGATITATAGSSGGSISSSASISASGGSSLAGGAVAVAGATGGSITFRVLNAAGSIRLETGTDIIADGGGGTGALAGGAGGTVTIQTVDQLVSITGSIVARGGNQNGGGSGGTGGQVVVNTDTDAAGGKGDITLTSRGSIDVSSGTGGGGGSARNNGGGAVDPSATPGLIAVIFDAGGSLAGSIDAGTEGVVQNLGQITARGRGTNGNGGDVYFDGRQPGGVLDPVAGTQNRTGSGSGLDGIFQPD